MLVWVKKQPWRWFAACQYQLRRSLLQHLLQPGRQPRRPTHPLHRQPTPALDSPSTPARKKTPTSSSTRRHPHRLDIHRPHPVAKNLASRKSPPRLGNPHKPTSHRPLPQSRPRLPNPHLPPPPRRRRLRHTPIAVGGSSPNKQI